MLRNSSPTSEIRWLECKNNNAGAVPAFGLVRSTGLDSAGNVFQVDQPNADSMEVMFNGPVPIPAGSNGGCTRDFPAWAYYETADGTPGVGDVWGAGNGSWKLRIGKTGYKIVAVDSTNQRVQVVPAPPAAGGTLGPSARLSLFAGGQRILNTGPVKVNFNLIDWDNGGFTTGQDGSSLLLPGTSKYLAGCSLNITVNPDPTETLLNLDLGVTDNNLLGGIPNTFGETDCHFSTPINQWFNYQLVLSTSGLNQPAGGTPVRVYIQAGYTKPATTVTVHTGCLWAVKVDS